MSSTFEPYRSWRVNSPAVSYDLVEGEVVAIHLESGIYYSLRGSAAVCWEGIVSGSTGYALGKLLASRFQVESAQADADVQVFVEELLRENLIVEGDQTQAVDAIPSPIKEPYSAPELEKFSDLQDLLLLDPIHEVNQRGWPHRT